MLKPTAAGLPVFSPPVNRNVGERSAPEEQPAFPDLATLSQPPAAARPSRGPESTPPPAPAPVLPSPAPILKEAAPSAPPVLLAVEDGQQVSVAVGSRPEATLFNGFLKVRSYELDVQRPSGVETVHLTSLNGPGHNCAMVGTVGLAPDGTPQIILKKGDTRLSRQLRGDSYVKEGPTGGRLDKVGEGPEKIGLGETAEELGGVPVEGSFRRMGTKLSPTMPNESTEADAYFSAIVQLGGKIDGDGSEMEAIGLIGPSLCDYREYDQKLRNGDVAEAGRTRTSYGRTFDTLGYIPELGVYVHDQPALKERFSTLGLGEPWDPRGSRPPQTPPDSPSESGGAPPSGAAQIDHADFLKREEVPLGIGSKMVDAETQHAATINGVSTPQSGKFLNQVMCHNYDRAKLVLYRDDPQQGPMVYFPDCERPLMALKATAFGKECDPSLDNTNLVRRDVLDFKVSRGEDPGPQLSGLLQSEFKLQSEPEALACASSASSGQSDLYYNFYAAQVDQPPAGGKFIPLAEALSGCRQGDGDSQTEATLMMLADKLHWIPQLGMSAEAARQLLR